MDQDLVKSIFVHHKIKDETLPNCLQLNTNILNNNVQNSEEKNINNWKACQTLCQKEITCQGFSYRNCITQVFPI
jgi:hypothetical protein